MTLKETLKQLEALGNEKVRAQNAKSGAGDNQFGVNLGDIRGLAKKIKTEPRTGAGALGHRQRRRAVPGHAPDPAQEALRRRDGQDDALHHLRAGGGLAERLCRPAAPREGSAAREVDGGGRPLGRPRRLGPHRRAGREEPDGLDLPALLDRIEKEMPDAAPEVQWTMNNTLAAIGIHFPKHRKRAIAIGEKIGLYRDWPVSKGCTPPFAPIWIDFMVNRQGALR